MQILVGLRLGQQGGTTILGVTDMLAIDLSPLQTILRTKINMPAL